MKLMDRFHLWEIKREIKFLEKKTKFLKQVLKHLEKEYSK